MSSNAEEQARTLRVVIIGYGLAGAVFHAPLVACTRGMTIAAIETNHPERQERARRDFPKAEILSSAQEIWHDPARYDLVVVAAPNRAHVPLGLAALNAGLPVVIDKPMAASVAEAEQLITASKRTGKLLSVFQNRRWDNDFLTVRQLIEAEGEAGQAYGRPQGSPHHPPPSPPLLAGGQAYGRPQGSPHHPPPPPPLLGPITRFESRFERYRAEPRPGAWRELPAPEEAGGLLYDLGSHLIDQALLLFGQPSSVYAEVEKRRPGAQVDDDSFVALSFAHGVRAHLWMSLVARRPGPRMRISGLRGTYEKWGLDPQEDALQAGMRPGDPHWGLEPPERWGKLSADVAGVHIDGPVETLPGAYERYYALLRDALVTSGLPPVDPADALATLRIIEAARESARTATVITL